MSASYCLMSLRQMLELPIGKLMANYHHVVTFDQVLVYSMTSRQDVRLDASGYDRLLSNAEGLAECLGEIGMVVTRGVALTVLEEIRKAEPDPLGGRNFLTSKNHLMILNNKISGMSQCLWSEASTKVAMMLPAEKVALFSPTEPHFGGHVRSQFPLAIPEIDEAAKCLSLGRPTACVFHLMRATELVLRAIHSCIDAAPPRNRNWSEWLQPIRDERQRRGRVWAENDFFQDVWQRLDAIKDAQRNATMHIESIYTEEDARVIFEATRAFMQKVASRMDQNGEPKA